MLSKRAFPSAFDSERSKGEKMKNSAAHRSVEGEKKKHFSPKQRWPSLGTQARARPSKNSLCSRCGKLGRDREIRKEGERGSVRLRERASESGNECLSRPRLTKTKIQKNFSIHLETTTTGPRRPSGRQGGMGEAAEGGKKQGGGRGGDMERGRACSFPRSSLLFLFNRDVFKKKKKL